MATVKVAGVLDIRFVAEPELVVILLNKRRKNENISLMFCYCFEGSKFR